jgi:hypothetical protein
MQTSKRRRQQLFGRTIGSRRDSHSFDDLPDIFRGRDGPPRPGENAIRRRSILIAMLDIGRPPADREQKLGIAG